MRIISVVRSFRGKEFALESLRSIYQEVDKVLKLSVLLICRRWYG
jgi:hypothetical protein